MKQLDIRFVKERDSERATYQLETIAKLQERLPKLIAAKFSDVDLRIRFASNAGFEIKGFKDADKRKFKDFLEELWEDSARLE